jgi:putative Mn2+ efflux pump MntP
MSFWSLVLIAIALSLDAFAIAVASGMAIRNLKLHHALKIAFAFGLFQAIMPVIGGLTGIGLRQYITTYDHWVIFMILTLLGLKMIYESFKLKEVEEEKDPLNSSVLLILAIATSLDALAVGVTLGLGHMAIMGPAILIGVITFAISLAGVYIGRHSRHVNERVMEVIAGLALIGIGIKILLQHLLA